jgi:rod shape-determining protein MreD
VTLRKVFVAALLLLTALLAQVTVVARLPLPVGVPDLVLLVVVCLALLEGPVFGMAVGFAVGLAADLLGAHLVGRVALLFTVVGYLCGRLDPDRTGVLVPIAAVAGASFGFTVVDSGISILLGGGAGGAGGLLRSALSLAVYDALLTPFVFPVVRSLLGRTDGSG